MTKKELLQLLDLGESQTVEFKTSVPVDIIGRNVCAFLNTKGGYLICGINEGLQVKGIEQASKLKDRLKINLQKGIQPSALISIDIQELEGKELLIIEVPSGKDIPFSYNNDIYVRQRAMTQKASVNIIKDMVLRKQVEPERWERRFSDHL